MTETNVNGVVLDDSIAKRLSNLQNGYANLIAVFLNNSISFLLENSQYFDNAEKELLDVLSSLNIARNELLGIVPEKKGGER